jgi:ribosome maturation protein SDO1
MKASLKQPITQVKFTNVAFVRLQIKGIKLELACYKNKLVDYRKGVESNLSDVLQVEQIFSNASKGKVARKEDIKKLFPKLTQEDIIKQILKDGEIQVSEKERDQSLDFLKKDIATWVCKMTINNKTTHPFPLSTILQAMDEIHFKIIQKDSSKKQALKVIKQLITVLPIRRAKIKIKLVVDQIAEKEYTYY